MLATVLFSLPFSLLPVLDLPEPARDCRLELLTTAALEERSLGEFERNIDSYIQLRRRFVRSIGAATIMDDEGGFLGDELRTVLVAARPMAQQGDFFTPPVANVLTAQVSRALLRGLAGMPGRLYAPLPGEPAPEVNHPFPFVANAVGWPALFLELPLLPRELSYALWGRDLVLVDVPANLVLDVLPDALPDGVYPGVLYP